MCGEGMVLIAPVVITIIGLAVIFIGVSIRDRRRRRSLGQHVPGLDRALEQGRAHAHMADRGRIGPTP